MILTLHDNQLASLESLEQALGGTAGLAPRVAMVTEAKRQAASWLCGAGSRYVTLKRAQNGW